ncbi:hypothetical protein FXO37_31991 [Capsicum annuum]|nr:hypothetical protein FXO37_31991 [Capsicum annuum]
MSGDGSDETDDPDYQRFLHQFANAATGGGISSFIQFLQEEAGDEEEDEEYEPDDGEDEDDDEEEEEEVSGRTTLRRVLYGHRDHVSSINNNSVNLENSENSVVESGDVVIATMRNGKGGEEEAFRGGEKEGGGGGDEGEEWNRSEIDGLFCTICMEAWTNDGDHQICDDIIYEEDEEEEEEIEDEEKDEEDEEEEDNGRTILRRVLYGHQDYGRANNAENSIVESGDAAPMRKSCKGGEAWKNVEKEEGG